MKLALILTAALSAAPVAPEAPAPQRMVIQQGDTFECTAPGGCFLANGAGLNQMVREIAAQIRDEKCSKPRPNL